MYNVHKFSRHYLSNIDDAYKLRRSKPNKSKKQFLDYFDFLGGNLSAITSRIRHLSRELLLQNRNRVQPTLKVSYLRSSYRYSEKATKFCKIFTLLLPYGVPVKSKVKISQNSMAFSEYTHSVL